MATLVIFQELPIIFQKPYQILQPRIQHTSVNSRLQRKNRLLNIEEVKYTHAQQSKSTHQLLSATLYIWLFLSADTFSKRLPSVTKNKPSKYLIQIILYEQLSIISNSRKFIHTITLFIAPSSIAPNLLSYSYHQRFPQRSIPHYLSPMTDQL